MTVLEKEFSDRLKKIEIGLENSIKIDWNNNQKKLCIIKKMQSFFKQ